MLATINNNIILKTGTADSSTLRSFDIKHLYSSLTFIGTTWWAWLLTLNRIQGIARQLPVYRDLAMVVNRSLLYEEVEKTTRQIGLDKLQKVQLFDIFESEKLGKDKKSLAISFTLWMRKKH